MLRCYALGMREAPNPAPITIRPAVPDDADGITRVYMESAEYHARLDPERYWIPAVEAIRARYREGWYGSHHPASPKGKETGARHPEPDANREAITLVAELGGEIVGFVDVRLDQRSPDPMLRETTYCHIVEIAISSRHQSQGIGGQLLQAAEEWGREQGAEFASLDYLANNTRAAALYRRMGYGAVAIKAVKRL